MKLSSSFNKIYDIDSYNLDDFNIIGYISSTGGFQKKVFLPIDNKFIKICCFDGDSYLKDNYVECLASSIASQLGFYALDQSLCKVIIEGNEYDGCVSEYALKDCEVFYGFKKLLEIFNRFSSFKEEFIHLSVMDKIDYIVVTINKYTLIHIEEVREYVINTLLIDLLVCNTDRHFNNYGFKENMGEFSLFPIFDCGRGMFIKYIDNNMTLEECMRYTYIEPFSECPFDLADIVKHLYKDKGYTLKIERKYLLSEIGEEYFLKMCNMLDIGVCIE